MRVNATVTTLTTNAAGTVNVIDTNISLRFEGDGKVRIYDVSNSAVIADVVGEPAVKLVEALYRYMDETIGT